MTHPANNEIIEQAKCILYSYKQFFGFADWSVVVEDKTDHDEDGTYAEVDADHMEKKLTVTLYKLYLKSNRQETLIHELIHGRIAMYQNKIEKRIEQIQYYEEEEAINDITRGFMELLRRFEME